MFKLTNQILCSVEECNTPVHASQLCSKHYQSFWRKQERERKKNNALKPVKIKSARSINLTNWMSVSDVKLIRVHEKREYSQRMSGGGYFNTQLTILPEYYNKDNIICQWILSHHTKRQHTSLPYKIGN